ncbi:MAG TPA: PD-(D/E)XK nuclease family protein [Bacteroidales bacterium]|jgi:hypothetical protein|nr:PD-(D/E)XK nuclease family protein [Bacteroidales bacterium]HQI44461.1 PD-(D/E)XK nuclease family protein [Bacteroidales bacterium]
MQKHIVSYSQFAKFWICPYQWMRDYILKEKVFEDSVHMSFGTAIHEALQKFLTIYYNESEETAYKLDLITPFIERFKQLITTKNIKYTQKEFDEFIEDGKAIISEFINPVNIKLNFSRDKYDLIGTEVKFTSPIVNNVNLDAYLDLVLKEKISGNIRIIDIKTATREWNNSMKEDFTKTSQLVLYKAVYSKNNNIPLSKIHVEFIILKRKLYENVKYKQTHIQIFKPPAYQENVRQVIKEFREFVEYCFTKEGLHKVDARYPKQPGKNKTNCKWCQYKKNGKCDGIADPPL